MLKRAFIFSFSFLILLISLMLVNLLIINKKDIADFKKITFRNKDEHLYREAYQRRENVKKDIYFIDDNKRKHFVIFSKSSDIFLNQKIRKYDLVEKLNDIKFFEIEPMIKNQLYGIKYIRAKNGEFFLPHHKFNLNDLNISFLYTKSSANLENLDLKNSYFEGIAKNLSVSLLEKKDKMKVYDFEGYFYPQEGIKCKK